MPDITFPSFMGYNQQPAVPNRKDIGPFQSLGLTANVTTVLGIGGVVGVSYPVYRASRLTALTCSLSGNPSGSTCTMRARKNGTPDSTIALSIVAGTQRMFWGRVATDLGLAFAEGDALTLEFVAPLGWLGTLLNLSATAELTEDL